MKSSSWLGIKFHARQNIKGPTMQTKATNVYVRNEIDCLGLAAPDIPVMSPVHFGQCAEDYLVLSMLRALSDREGIDLSQHKYIEIGANHPVATSSTYLLYTGLGMTGILVDANPYVIANLKRARPRDSVLNIAVSTSDHEYIDFYISDHSELSSLKADFIVNFPYADASIKEKIKIPCVDLNKLLQVHFPGTPPLFLSIDVEGMDADLVEHLDLSKMRPYLIQVESSIEWDPLNHSRIAKKLTDSSYLILAKTDVNLIAVDANRLGISPKEQPRTMPESRGQALKLIQISKSTLSSLISDCNVLSLDVFDTILIRQCLNPIDVFGFIEIKRKVQNFKEARVAAEKEARKTFRKSFGRETSIEEIYSILRKKIEIPPDLLQYELRTELDFLYPNPDALVAISLARNMGKRVIAVSDMYLPSEIIDQLLKAKGIFVDAVYSSCDFREKDVGKYNSKMYQCICENENVMPESILHIGDNYKSDFRNALAVGVKAIHSHKLNRFLLSESPSLARLMRIKSSSTSGIVLGVISKGIFLSNGISHAERFGYQIAGPLLAGFIKFILDRSREKNISQLLLLARDGVIVEKALNILRPATISWRTVPCSRRMAVFPLLASGSLDALSILNYDKNILLSPQQLIARLSLDDHLSVDSNLLKQPMGYAESVACIKEHLITQARSERDALLKLLQPELEGRKNGNRFAWVDVGWALTSITALNQIIEEPAPGFFVGSHERADNSPLLEGYLFERGLPERVCRSVMGAVEVIELIFSDTSPSTAFVYLDEKGQIRKFSQEESSMESLRRPYINDVHAGALRFIEEIKPFFDGLDCQDLRKYNREVLVDLLEHPDKFLYEALSQVPHDRFGSASNWKTIGDYWKPSQFYPDHFSYASVYGNRKNEKGRLLTHIELYLLSAVLRCSMLLPKKTVRRLSRSVEKRSNILSMGAIK